MKVNKKPNKAKSAIVAMLMSALVLGVSYGFVHDKLPEIDLSYLQKENVLGFSELKDAKVTEVVTTPEELETIETKVVDAFENTNNYDENVELTVPEEITTIATEVVETEPDIIEPSIEGLPVLTTEVPIFSSDRSDIFKNLIENLARENSNSSSIDQQIQIPENYKLKDVLLMILKSKNQDFIQDQTTQTTPEETNPVETQPVETTEITTMETLEETTSKEDETKEEPLNLTSQTNTRHYTYTDGIINVNGGAGFEVNEDLQKEFNSIRKDDPRKISFYITDPETNATISYNEDFWIHPASTIKAGIALCACKMIDRGEISFDDVMAYEKKHEVGGSGSIQYKPFGTEYTIKELMHLMIYESDNVAYYMLLDKVGHDNYNAMVDDLGLEYNLGKAYKFNFITCRDLNLIWQEIYAYKDHSETGEYLFEEFYNAKFDYYLTALGKKSPHKSGFNDEGYHDSAIVFCGGKDDKKPYIITILTEPLNGRHSINSDSANFTKYAKFADKVIDSFESYKEANPNKFDTREIESEM